MITLFILLLIIVITGKGWRFFVETSDDIKLIRMLEPWYWFVFLNLSLTTITCNYDYNFALVGLLFQLALCVWFAISMGWIIQSCHHKTDVLQPSLFDKGRTVRFCHRCGTRLPKEFHAPHHVPDDDSWENLWFQVPPALFKYIVFWLAQSIVILISLFLALKYLKKPDLQHQAILVGVILLILFPPIIYFIGKFRKYLSDTKGLIWWKDLRWSFVIWLLLIGILLWVFYNL
jgi:hypothetical protein